MPPRNCSYATRSNFAQRQCSSHGAFNAIVLFSKVSLNQLASDNSGPIKWHENTRTREPWSSCIAKQGDALVGSTTASSRTFPRLINLVNEALIQRRHQRHRDIKSPASRAPTASPQRSFGTSSPLLHDPFFFSLYSSTDQECAEEKTSITRPAGAGRAT